jgi:hypothetical protein
MPTTKHCRGINESEQSTITAVQNVQYGTTTRSEYNDSGTSTGYTKNNNHTTMIVCCVQSSPVNVEPQYIFSSSTVRMYCTGIQGCLVGIGVCRTTVRRQLTFDVRTTHLHEEWTQHCRSTLSYILTSKRVLVNQEFCSSNISRGTDTRTTIVDTTSFERRHGDAQAPPERPLRQGRHVDP